MAYVFPVGEGDGGITHMYVADISKFPYTVPFSQGCVDGSDVFPVALTRG